MLLQLPLDKAIEVVDLIYLYINKKKKKILLKIYMNLIELNLNVKLIEITISFACLFQLSFYDLTPTILLAQSLLPQRVEAL